MLLALLLVTALGIDWASGYAIAGYVINHGVSPYGYALWQSLAPAILLLITDMAITHAFGKKDGVGGTQTTIQHCACTAKVQRMKQFAYALVCGLFGIAIPNLLIYIALNYFNVGIITVIANSSPIFTYLLALLVSVESFHKWRFSLVCVGVCGVMLMISAQFITNTLSTTTSIFTPIQSWLPRIIKFLNYDLSHSSHSVTNHHASKLLHANYTWLANCKACLYAPLLLAIPLCYGLSAVYIAKYRPIGTKNLTHAWRMLTVASIVMAIIVINKGGFYSLHINDFNSWLIVLEIILSSVGYLLLFAIIKLVGPIYFTLVNAIAGLMGMIYAKAIFNQQLHFLSYSAAAMIIIAIIGLSYNQYYLQYHKR